VVPADRQALLRAACRMPAERAEHIEAVGMQTDGAPPGMPAAGRVLGEIELAGDLRSEWPATNSSAARERMRSSAWRHARLGRCDGRRLLHSATLPGPGQDVAGMREPLYR